jgi:hypothetical protein
MKATAFKVAFVPSFFSDATLELTVNEALLSGRYPTWMNMGQCLMKHDVLACVVSKVRTRIAINRNVGIARLALNVDECRQYNECSTS